jgi:hypothetical protein
MEQDHHHKNRNNGTMRIPLTLQAVFLNGNRGLDVNTPPPDKAAMKTFRRWRWPLRSSSHMSHDTTTTAADSVDIEVPKQLRRIEKIKRTKVSNAVLVRACSNGYKVS